MKRLFLATVSAALLAGTSPAAAIVHCSANPFRPECCPAPCPVFDASKLAQYIGVQQQELDELSRWTAQVGIADLLSRSIGSTANPRLSLGPATPASSLASQAPAFTSDNTQRLLRMFDFSVREGRIEADRLQQENLPTLRAFGAAFGAPKLPVQPAAQTALDLWRGRTVAKTGVISQLTDATATAAAVNASQLMVQALTRGEPVPAPDAPLYTPITPAKHQPALRPLDLMGILRGAISFNNAGALVSQILSSIPLLQKSVDTYNQIVGAQAENVRDLAGLFSGIYVDPQSAAAAVLQLARQLDPTRYVDNTTAPQSAARAASAIVQQLTANPEIFGTLLPSRPVNRDDSPARLDFSGAAPIVEAWLGNTKYGEFWQPIAAGAQRVQATAQTVTQQIAQHYPAPLDAAGIATYARQAVSILATSSPGADLTMLNGIAARPGQTFLRVR